MIAQNDPAVVAKTRPCPVCGTAADLEEKFRDITLYRCSSCDHCFTDIDALDYLGEYDEAWEALHPNWFENPNLALFELVATTIEDHKPDGSVLDVGSGRGELLAYLRDREPRLQLTGVDFALKPEIEGVEILRCDVATADFGGRQWDAIASLATIEHVADVHTFVARLHDLLRPDGVAVVMTIDDRSVLYAASRLLKRLGYRTAYERLYDRFHLNHFNTKSLRTAMERGGFDTLAHHHHNIPIEAVDMPTDSAFLRFGVWCTFALGRLTRRTYEQTIICRRH
jgi:SAM-dependent methyltransferase